tara:strand:+ start:525 stop:2738 length:2214 start_codon:yes stop_codon:yes gene_type:complete
MPAGLKIQSKIITTLCIVTVMLLSACSRDNPLSIPQAYIEEPEAFCLENGPYASYTLLESIDITNTVESLPENYPDGYDKATLLLTAPFLVNSSDITPKAISDTTTVYNEETDSYDTVLIVLEKTLSPDLVDKLSYDESRLIEGYSPQVLSLSISVNYPIGGVQASSEIDEDQLSASLDLEYGKNIVTTKAAASIRVPRTFVDCINPLTVKELTSDEFKDDDRYKVLSVVQSFIVEIDREDLSSFEQKELISIISSSEDDKFGRVMAVNDDFLVIGTPSEDSDAKGIILADKFITSDVNEKFIQNEDSIDSGAVYVFQKDTVNSWVFHSFIKASNSEPGDLFGSAISLDESRLVISAPGEGSITSGVHNSMNAEVDNFKLNNSAPSSGAVYVYELDESSNNWSEKFYIKPEVNTISDGDFDKGFGSQLLLYKNKLLIAAPLEDSDNGVANDSSQPDSGAVYIYRVNINSGWSYVGTLKAYNPGAGDKFGSAIAASDEYFVVGSPFEDHSNRVITDFQSYDEDPENPFEKNTRKDSGAVYVYKHSFQNDLFSEIAHIKPTNSDAFDYFGSSVSIINNKLFVGSIGEDGSGKGLNRDMDKNNLEDSGAVYVFDSNLDTNLDSNLDTDLWTESAYIKANDSQEGALFGKYLTTNSDSLFVSAPLFDSPISVNAGKVYFYKLMDDTINQELLFQPAGASEEMRFGSQIVTFGGNLVIGASGYIEGESGIDETFVGKVFTYD